MVESPHGDRRLDTARIIASAPAQELRRFTLKVGGDEMGGVSRVSRLRSRLHSAFDGVDSPTAGDAGERVLDVILEAQSGAGRLDAGRPPRFLGERGFFARGD